jgi:hypothetical protein
MIVSTTVTAESSFFTPQAPERLPEWAGLQVKPYFRHPQVDELVAETIADGLYELKRTSAASSQRTIPSSRKSSASATSASGTSSSRASALMRV